MIVPWLVGTDGAHSSVRKQLGLRLVGASTRIWLNADVVLDVDLPSDSNHLIHTGTGTLLLVPFPEPDKWRVIDTVDVDSAEDPEVVRSRLARKLSAALRRPVRVSPPTWVSVFTVQQRMVERMRSGRCFVAGDAAHVHSPASGQGMNTGIQDAYNLAWKLADVVRGLADEQILDSYDAERMPIGAALLRSTGTATSLVALRNVLAPVLMPVGLGIVRRVAPLKRRIEGKMIRGFCGLTLNYADSPLRLPGSHGGVASGHRVGCSTRTAQESAGWREVCVELTDPRWTLLSVPADARDLRFLVGADEHHEPAVSVRTVSERGDAGPHPLADPGGRVRRDFALMPGEYVLIRPDGYVAGYGPIGEIRRAMAGLFLRTKTHEAPG
jgi:NADPH-dependent dioxygenase